MLKFIARSAIAVLVVSIGACVLQTETMPGPKGDPGVPGDTSVTLDGGAASTQDLADLVVALQAQVQALSDPACPFGYKPTAKPFVPSNADSVLCKNTHDDEVVKVSAGGAAFWIDRYEASIWEGTTPRFANGNDSDLGSTFPMNGQSSTPWVARSVPSVIPARNLTWFQAQAACRASGKRLPNGEEWLAAARGTSDPLVENDGSLNTRCNTSSMSARMTGRAGDPTSAAPANGCFSDWGAEDMIGNANEWTSDWFAAPSIPSIVMDGGDEAVWPNQIYHDDGASSVASRAWITPPIGTGWATQIPVAASRGGNRLLKTGAGIWYINLAFAPAGWDGDLGFRCLVPR
jgi:formylglycine-generating enzyme required for sulfatase activity